MSRLHPFARLCIAAVGLFAAQLVAGLGLTAIYIGVKMSQAPAQPLDKIIGQVARVTETNTLLLTLLVYPIGLLWLGFCRAKLDKRSFISLGLRRSRLGSNLARGVATGFLSIAVIWAILWVTGTISVAGFSAEASQPTVILALLGWLIAFAAVGFFEEFVFRGYALHNLTNWLGWRAAVIIQAIIFALIHLTNLAMLPREAWGAALGAMPSIFLIGVFFALSYRKTGSLWFPIGFHAAWNFSLGCLFSLPVSGIKTFQLLDVQSNTQSWLSGGSFGAEGSFFLLPVLAALIWFVLQAPDHPQALLDLELVQPKPVAQPPIVTAPIVETAEPIEDGIEDGAERENRYRTKFGTSEGFDSDMLHELRELQQQRESSEAQTRAERAAEQMAIVQTELLKPPIVAAPVAKQAENPEVEAAEIVTIEAMPKPIIVETKVEVEKPKLGNSKAEETKVAIAKKKVEVVAEKPKVEAAPKSEDVEPEAAPLPIPAKKKSLPKW